MKHILTLDVGTTAVKACLFDSNLGLLAESREEYALEADGSRVEVAPQVYLEAVTACVSQLPDRSKIAAISITTQGETLIPVGADGTPLCKAVVWLDSRADAQAAFLSARLSRQTFYEETGLPELSGALPLAKLQWFRERMPALYEKTAQFLLLEDYLIFRLTGRFVTEKSLLTSTGYFSLKTDDYWREGLSLAGIAAEKLPEPLECGTVVGPLLPEAAKALSLSSGALVVTGAMDQVAAALAAGCTKPGTVSETTGTAMVAAAYTEAPQFSSSHHVTIYRHAKKGAFLYLPISNTAGMSLKWYQKTFCPARSYEELDTMAAKSAPGANGLTFLPYLSGAVDPHNLPDATGCFFGIRLSTTQEDFLRATLEAIAYQLRDFLSMLEGLGCQADTIRSMGGGSLSSLWMQLKADVCFRPFYTLSTAQATSLGAAMLAAKAVFGTEPAADGAACGFFPNEAKKAAYDAGYDRYCRLSAALQPLYTSDKF